MKAFYRTERCVHGIYIPSNEDPQREEDHSQGKNTDWTDGLAHIVMDYLKNNMNPDDTMATV